MCVCVCMCVRACVCNVKYTVFKSTVNSRQCVCERASQAERETEEGRTCC